MPPGVPATTSPFVGRTREGAELRRLLRQERLVTVVGPGGCGKTRLAIETVGGGTPDLLVFVELASADGALEDRLLTTCGYRDDPAHTPRERLRDRLSRSPGLLVLDNCEHVRDDAAALAGDLLRHCPDLRILATSRVGLGLPGEALLVLGGLDPDGDAAALLIDRARRVQPGLPGGRATEEVAREICRLLDGLPLAIELAAAHARSLPLPAIREEMGNRLGFLVGRDPTALPQHRSLAASIGWTVDLVDEAGRRALSALSVVEGRFGLDVALAVTGGDRAALEHLVDVSLVQYDPEDGRYLLLGTVREYAGRRLSRAARTEAGERLLRWATSLAAEARTGLERGDAAVVRRVAAEDAGIGAALRVAVDTGRRLDAAAAVVADLAFAWSLRGRCALGRAEAERVAAALDPPPPPLAWARAFLAVYSGDLEAGLELAAGAATGAAAAGDDRTYGRALTLTGMTLGFTDPAAAEPLLAAAVACATSSGDDWGMVEGLQVLAYTHLFRTDLPEALRCVDEAQPGLARLGHPQLLAWDAAIRAQVAVEQGHSAEAVRRGREAHDLAVGVGEPVSAGGALLPLLRGLVAGGRTDEAIATLAGHRLFSESHPGLGSRELLLLAAAEVAAPGPPDAAAAAAAVAQGAAVEGGVTAYGARAAVLHGIGLLRSGNAAAAQAATARARHLAGAVGDRNSECAAALVDCAAARGHGRGAAGPAHRALGAASGLGLAPVVADGLDLVAGLCLDAGRPRVAARLHAAADRLREELGLVPSPLAVHLREDDGPGVAVALGEAALAEARREGAALDATAAVAYAERSRGRRGRPTVGWDSLTPTERDVVTLVAEGLSNQAIGDRLLVTSGTVRTHLRSVFAKLGVTSRAELAAESARRSR